MNIRLRDKKLDTQNARNQIIKYRQIQRMINDRLV